MPVIENITGVSFFERLESPLPISAVIMTVVMAIPAVISAITAIIPTISPVPIAMLSEAIWMNSPVIDLPVPSDVIPAIPSDSVGKPAIVNNHPRPMAIMV
jgi:hypothetical protein